MTGKGTARQPMAGSRPGPSLEGFLEIQARQGGIGEGVGQKTPTVGWGLGRKLGWSHWRRGGLVQMENYTTKDVGRIPGEGRGHRLKEHLGK